MKKLTKAQLRLIDTHIDSNIDKCLICRTYGVKRRSFVLFFIDSDACVNHWEILLHRKTTRGPFSVTIIKVSNYDLQTALTKELNLRVKCE